MFSSVIYGHTGCSSRAPSPISGRPVLCPAAGRGHRSVPRGERVATRAPRHTPPGERTGASNPRDAPGPGGISLK